MYNYLSYFFKFRAEEISIKNKSFLEDLSKGFKLKSVYTTKGDNTEKAYDDLVLNNEKMMMCFIKKQTMSLVIAVKIFFKKQKSCLI